MNSLSVWRIAALSLLLLSFLIILGLWVFRHRAMEYTRQYIIQQVAHHTDSAYHLQLDTLILQPARRRIVMQGIRLQATAKDSAPTVQTIAISKVSLGGISLQALIRKRLHAGHLHISQPRLWLQWPTKSNLPTDTTATDSARAAPHWLAKLRIRHLQADSGQLMIRKQGADWLRVAGWHISGRHPETWWPRQFQQAEGTLQLDSLSLAMSAAEQLTIGKIQLNLSQQRLQLHQVHWQPLLNKYDYVRHKGHQVARNQLQVGLFALHDIDWPALLSKRQFRARHLLADSLQLESFKDKRIPLPADEYKPTPNEMVNRLPLPFAIDTIQVRNSRVYYSEIPANGGPEAGIDFTELQATINGLSNDTVFFGGRQPAVLSASARLQGMGQLSMQWSRYPGEPENQYVKGQLTELDLPRINGILESAAYLQVQSGHVQSLDFSFVANAEASQGELKMQYEGLQVNILKKETSGQLSRRRFLSLLANQLVRSQNPSKKGDFITGTIAARRDVRKSVFAFWWQSVLSGITNTILKPSAEKQLHKRKRKK